MNFVIEILAYICECVTLLLCIHSFLGEKFRLDYKTVLLVIVDVTTLMIILNFNLPNITTFVAQVFYFMYAWHKFRISLSQNVVLMLLDILAISAVQAIAMLPTYIILALIGLENEKSAIGLCINVISVVIVLVVLQFIKLNKLYIKLIKLDKIIVKVLVVCVGLVIYLMIKYKVEKEVNTWAYFSSGIMASMVIVVVFYWQKERYENKKKNLEIHMQNLYGKAFEGMIENIRIRQHDFKNQLAAIYGMHLTAENFEDLVERQREYCDHLVYESRYDNILTKCNDKILAGFLYTKLSEAEKLGAEIEFDVVVNQMNYNLAVYEIIEIIGILIDNAIEYEHKGKRRIYFQLMEKEKKFCILCRNVTDYVPIESINKYFKKGFSTKGENRGLGLYNLKKLLEGKGEIIVTNNAIENENWLEFKIEIN